MTDELVTVPPAAGSDAASSRMRPRATAATRRQVGRVLAPARPLWQTAFSDPVRESHISLRGLGPAERHLARFGLVTLALLLVSVLFSDFWRRGELLPLDSGSGLTFLPVGLLPVTLVAFLVAWTLLTWGALAASPGIRVATGVAFLLTNASLGVATSVEVSDHPALRYGPELVKVGYFLPAGCLVTSVLLARAPRLWRWALPVMRTLCLAGLLSFFLGHLWLHTAYTAAGLPGQVQSLMSGTITEIDGLLLPLVYVSGVLVIDFSLDVAEGVAESARAASTRVARWLLVGLLAVKLWFVLVLEWGEWVTYVGDRPTAVARTVVSVVLLALLTRAVTRFASTDGFDVAKEYLMYGSGVALALAYIVVVLVVGSGIVLIAQAGAEEVPWYVTEMPTVALVRWAPVVAAAIAVAVGLWLLRRTGATTDRAGGFGRELGSGLVIIGAWVLAAQLLELVEVDLGFSDALVDVVVTLALVVILVRSWRRLDTGSAVVMAAVAVFSWLVATKGDWLTVAGGLLGLPAILVVVVGIAFSLAGDSAFTRTSSKRLPKGARVLLFVGYLTLSTTILHWVEATHAESNADYAADTGYYMIGLPWAAWLVGRRLVRLGEAEAEPTPPSADPPAGFPSGSRPVPGGVAT